MTIINFLFAAFALGVHFGGEVFLGYLTGAAAMFAFCAEFRLFRKDLSSEMQ